MERLTDGRTDRKSVVSHEIRTYEEMSLDEKDVLRFRVRNTNDEVIETTKENLRSPDDPDIGWIPTTLPEKKKRLHLISPRKILMILPIQSLSHHCSKNVVSVFNNQ